jgi:transmembrane sensor
MSATPGGSSGLLRYVTQRPDPARADRMWAAVGPRLRRRMFWQVPIQRWAFTAVLAVLALLAGRALAPQAPSDQSLRDATLETGSGGQSLRLPEGTTVELGAATRARLVSLDRERSEVALDRGEVTLDVVRAAGRAWVVSAGAYEVRVVGTKFTVRREVDPLGGQADRVSVRVERGRVEVHTPAAPDQVRALAAGEGWESAPPATAAAAPPTSAQPASDPPRAPTEAVDPAASAVAEPAEGAEPPAIAEPAPPSWEELAKARKYPEAWAALGKSEGLGRSARTASAEKLLRLAELARANGKLRDAAKAYDALRTRFRGDARAGLAAFELGRLRLDTFGDAAGAAEALADAIAMAPGAPFRQDAEARRVQALHASGATSACVAARDAYLARYPSGAYTAAVRAWCTGSSSSAGPASSVSGGTPHTPGAPKK